MRLMKKLSGHAARSARSLLWAATFAFAAACGLMTWRACAAGHPDTPAVALWTWAGASLLVAAIMCALACEWEVLGDFRRAPVVWETVLCMRGRDRPPSWLQLAFWLALLPAEAVASLAVWPVVLLVRAAREHSLPGNWD